MNSNRATDKIMVPGGTGNWPGVHALEPMPRDVPTARGGHNPEQSAGPRRARPRDAEGRFVFSLAGDAANHTVHLDEVPDWIRLLQIAWDAGATGALRDHIKRHREHTMPLEMERTLACLALERDARMRALERRTVESIALLRSAGIEVALLKGAALATTLYGSFAARPMNDVDLLVHPDRASEAKQLMRQSGWERDPELPDDQAYATHHHMAPMIDSLGSRSRLEIHRTLLPVGHPFALPIADLWAGMQPASLAGHRVAVLGPTYHALHIAIHFAWSHTMREGAWNAFRDLGAMERAGMIDWTELVRVARRARAASCCYWTLSLAGEMMNLRVPDEVLAALAPITGRTVRRRLARHFVHMVLRQDATQLSDRLDRALWSMAMQPCEQGHGDVRPWLVSAALTPARRIKETASRTGRAARYFGRVARSSACIARLLWN